MRVVAPLMLVSIAFASPAMAQKIDTAQLDPVCCLSKLNGPQQRYFEQKNPERVYATHRYSKTPSAEIGLMISKQPEGSNLNLASRYDPLSPGRGLTAGIRGKFPFRGKSLF